MPYYGENQPKISRQASLFFRYFFSWFVKKVAAQGLPTASWGVGGPGASAVTRQSESSGHFACFSNSNDVDSKDDTWAPDGLTPRPL